MSKTTFANLKFFDETGAYTHLLNRITELETECMQLKAALHFDLHHQQSSLHHEIACLRDALQRAHAANVELTMELGKGNPDVADAMSVGAWLQSISSRKKEEGEDSIAQ